MKTLSTMDAMDDFMRAGKGTTKSEVVVVVVGRRLEG